MQKLAIIFLSILLSLTLVGCQRDVTPPAVEYTFPLPNSQGVSLDSVITITFSEPMNQDTAERLVQIQPLVAVNIDWQGNTMRLTPRHPLTPGTDYDIGFITPPTDRAGNKLPLFSFRFSTIAFTNSFNSIEGLSWLPDNRTILFIAERKGLPRLHLVDTVSGNVRELDVLPGHQLEATVNRQGTMVAYIGGTGEPVLHLHDLSTGKTTPVLLRINGDLPSFPQFSPDGKSLVLYGVIGRSDAHSDIYQSLWAYNLATQSATLISPTGGSVRFLGYSDDSSRVYFLHTFEQYIHSHNFRYDLWEAVVATGQQRQLSQGGLIHNFARASQDPTAQRFVYGTWEARDIDANIIAEPRNIYILQVEPFAQRALLTAGHNADPQFSPLGQQILLISDSGRKGPGQDLFVMDIEGRNMKQLTFSVHPKMFPRWSRDGKQIAFVEMHDESPVIFIMNANGADLRRVISSR